MSALLHSEAIDQIAAALAAAQAAMPNAAKEKTNPAFRSRYADLASVRDAVTPSLSAAKIAVVQAPALDESGLVRVETRLLHASGQWIACVVSAAPRDGSPQAIGSAITYLRRYGLMALTGIAPEDDDGNAASHPRRDERPPEPAKREHDPSWAGARADFCGRLARLSDGDGYSYEEVAEYSEAKGRPRPSTMSQEQRDRLYTHLTSEAGRADINAFLKRAGKPTHAVPAK